MSHLTDQHYNKRMKIFYNISKRYDNQDSVKKGYIFLLENKKNRKKYCGGTVVSKPKKGETISAIKSEKFYDDLKKYKSTGFSLKIIEEIEFSLELEFMIKIDFYKIKHNTIKKGYNSELCFNQSDRMFGYTLQTTSKNFLTKTIKLNIDKYLLNRDYNDDSNYNQLDGYIYLITNRRTNKKYYGYIDENMKMINVINNIYDIAMMGNIKQNKLAKAFIKYPYTDFSYEIVKKKEWGNNINLVRETNILIKKYNTIKYGYNNIKKFE